MVHLTNIAQAPPSLGLSILYGCQVSTYGMTPRPRMTLWLSLCLVYSLDSPGSYSHVSLGVESFHIIARCDCTCSHTSIFDAVRVKYRKGTYSVTIVTSLLRSWPCYELHSSVASLKKSEIRGLYSQMPLPFWQAMAGCIAIGSGAELLVCFLSLHKPMDVQFHCVIIKRLQLKRKK